MAGAAPRKRAIGITDAVLRLLAGEAAEAIAKSSGFSALALEAARDRFLAAGTKALASDQPRAPDRRGEIIQVAIQLFGEKGYKSTRLEDIADSLGMTRPALYYYFRNKDELLSAVIDDAVHKDRDHSISTKLRPDEDIVDGIRERLRNRVRYLLGDRLAVHRLLQSERQSLPEHAALALEQSRRLEVRALEGFLEQGNRSGELDVKSPVLTAMLILSLAGAATRWFDPARASNDEMADAITTLVMEGIVARAPNGHPGNETAEQRRHRTPKTTPAPL